MNGDSATWAFLFLVIVAVAVVVGIIVGMIVAGGLDRLQAPRPTPSSDGPATPDPPGDPAPGTLDASSQHPVQEDQHP